IFLEQERQEAKRDQRYDGSRNLGCDSAGQSSADSIGDLLTRIRLGKSRTFDEPRPDESRALTRLVIRLISSVRRPSSSAIVSSSTFNSSSSVMLFCLS